MESPHGYCVRIPLHCAARSVPFLILHFTKASSPPRRHQQMSLPYPSFTSTDVNSDCRPISLKLTVSKILESFPSSWLLHCISDKMDPFQFGSLQGSSTTLALVYLLQKPYEACEKPGSLVRVCFLDFFKVFDLIDHNNALGKLQQMNVRPVLIISLRQAAETQSGPVLFRLEVRERGRTTGFPAVGCDDKQLL